MPDTGNKFIKESVGRYAPGAPGCVSHLQLLVDITALKSSFLFVLFTTLIAAQ